MFLVMTAMVIVAFGLHIESTFNRIVYGCFGVWALFVIGTSPYNTNKMVAALVTAGQQSCHNLYQSSFPNNTIDKIKQCHNDDFITKRLFKIYAFTPERNIHTQECVVLDRYVEIPSIFTSPQC